MLHYHKMSNFLEKSFRSLGTLLLAGVLSASGGEPLTLDQCLSIALDDNPTVRVADMEVRKADYSKKETIGALLPTLSFGGTYNRTLKKQVAYMDVGAFGDMGEPGHPGMSDGADSSDLSDMSDSSDKGIKMGLDNAWSAGFTATMPLIAPQLWQALRLSDVQIASAVEKARASRLDLVNQVKNAFYALLLAHDSRRVVRESYDMAALTHEIYQKRFAAGDASEYDVLRTSVQMKNVEPEIIQADIAIRRAHLQLAVLMGLEADAPFEIAGSLADYEKDMYETAMNLDTDISANTSLALNEIQTKTLRRQLNYDKAAFLPTLALQGNYNWTSSSNGSPLQNFRWTPYSVVGLTLSVPIFQGGQRWNRIRQSQIALEEMAYTRENLTRQLRSQAELAADNITLNVKQIASSSESVAQATRAHDIQQKSFDIGAASYLDLRDSELSLTRARLAYYQSVYNYLVANSDLELLLGNAPLESYKTRK